MSIEGISGTPNPIATSQIAITLPKPEATTTPAPAKTETSPHYTVELTGTALAKSLKLAGQNPAQIALKMGIDIKTVDSYLSIKVATATPAPVPATPAPTTAPAPATTQTSTNATATPAEEAKEPAKEKVAEASQGKK